MLWSNEMFQCVFVDEQNAVMTKKNNRFPEDARLIFFGSHFKIKDSRPAML